MPSVPWRCWLGGRKGIRPVKNRVVGCWRGYLSGARCRLAYGPADAIATNCLFASVKSRLVVPLWYRLTGVVPDKGPLNVCVCVNRTARTDAFSHRHSPVWQTPPLWRHQHCYSTDDTHCTTSTVPSETPTNSTHCTNTHRWHSATNKLHTSFPLAAVTNGILVRDYYY